MPAYLCRPATERRAVARLLLASVGLALAFISTAKAQTPVAPDQSFTGLGSAVPGGTGLRGSADATLPDLQQDEGGLPNSNAATLNGAAAVPVKKVNIPQLRGTALPERYPVTLPPLVPYPTAVRLRRTNAPAIDEADVEPAPSTAALPSLPRKTIRPDENPFGPIGYGVGSTRILPYIEQSLGYDSNPEQVATGVKASAFSRTEGGLTIQSDWSAHELKGDIRGGYDDFFSNPRANRPDAVGVVDLRIDATRDTKLDGEARFSIDTQRPGSPELNVAVRDRPLITSFGGTAGVTEELGRFSLGLHGLVDRTAYEDGELTDGTKVPLAYQDLNDYGVKSRLGYDLKPGLQPFVEVGYDQRIHDATIDPFGYRRDSDGVGGRVGSTFEVWPQLTGTISGGYATRHYDDPRLSDLNGPTAAALIAWAATPLTTVTLQGSTAFNETTVIGASGIESRLIGASVSHALFRSVTLTGALSYQQDDYVGAPIVEKTLTASLKAEYHLSRSLVLTGTLSHQRLRSTDPGSGYTQEIALVGLRLQH